MSKAIAIWLPHLLAPAVLGAILAVAAPVAARDVVPAPPGGGPGVNLYAADQENPLDLPAPGGRIDLRESAAPPSKGAGRYDDVGGDDVPVVTINYAYTDDLAVATNGDLFSVVMYSDEEGGDYELIVRRSDDGGTTWRNWGHFDSPTPEYRYIDPQIHVAEGLDDRVFVVYLLDPGSDPYEVHVAWSPLELETADFSADTVAFTSLTSYMFDPSFTTDAVSWNSYFCYLTFSADDGNGNDVYFMRSTDQGTSWESPYVIGTIAVNDRGYYRPRVAVGYDGWVHVAWFLGFDLDHEFDNTIRYRRAPDYANGGLGNWENIQSITSHTDDVDVIQTEIAASLVSPRVMLRFLRRQRYPDGSYSWAGNLTLTSSDAGASWDGSTVVGTGFEGVGDILHQEVNDRWLMSVEEYGSWGFRWAAVAAPANWSEVVEFADEFCTVGAPAMVLDPSHDDRIGTVGGDGDYVNDTYTYLFDGEWRRDPGYPNYEDGFPIEIPVEPRSDPGVVDLDGDGDLEIVYSDDYGSIHVYQHDGTPLPGWPVDVGTSLSYSPVAVGDLNGDGQLSVVVGTWHGQVFAYHADGTLMDGWPADAHVEDLAYVSIGALGGPYPRAVVVAAGGTVVYKDWRGERYPGSINRIMTGRIIDAPAAIGDIDGDGVNEVVVAGSHSVFAFPMDDYGWDINLDLESWVTGGVALGDFDLDGDVEVVVPLLNGVVHLLEGDGSEFPGDWPVTVADSPIEGVAIGQCLGGAEPEIAVTAREELVSVLWYDGYVGSGWPADPGGSDIYAAPIMGRVDGTSSDVIASAMVARGWAWNNFGGVIPGWPKQLDERAGLAPAYGDLDLDGRAEIVFLDAHTLNVVDVGVAPSSATTTWAMAGHDPQRTGCADCAEDLVAVEDAPTGVTRVSMAAPWPNPIAGQATFSYAVPIRARVELAIYDVRGRRVATVHRAEEAAGRHTICWNGRDDDGRPLASGQYVAALKVRGPGVNETLSRKVTVLR